MATSGANEPSPRSAPAVGLESARAMIASGVETRMTIQSEPAMTRCRPAAVSSS